MYFPNELWSIVKEYAGIYSVGTNYKVSKVSKDKLLKFYGDEFNKRIKNPSKYKADLVKQCIMKDIRFKMTRDKWVALHKLCNPIKEKSKLAGQVGEEISWFEDKEYCLGLIVKQYKSGYKVRRYKTKITLVETHMCFKKVDGRYTTEGVPHTFTTHTFVKDKFHKGHYTVDCWSWGVYLSSEDGHREHFTSWTHEYIHE